MRSAVVIVAALLAAGCGGGDDAETASEPATEAAIEDGAAYDITVGEFIAELQPEKQRILDEFVADSPACKGVAVDNGFVLLVSAAAIDADQDAPLAGLVEDQC